MFESMVLGIILEKDLTGYDIKKIIEKSFGVYYKASYGSLYPALKRLEKKEYVTTYEEPNGGRNKIFYSITEEGKKSFFEWLTTPMEVLNGTNLNLTKIYFFNYLPKEISEKQLLIYENNNVNYLRELEEMEKKFREMENIESFYYKLSTLYYGISITKKTIEWCRHIREGKPLYDFIK